MTVIDPVLTLKQCIGLRVSDGATLPLLEETETAQRILVLVWPQLGDFDSLEYAWWLQREAALLSAASITLRCIGIGDRTSGEKFCHYTGLNPALLWVDPQAALHRTLGLYQGLSLQVPGFNASQNAWLNLLLMCAGIGSPGTLAEVLRGYTGDRQAPQLIGADEVVQAGPLPALTGAWFDRAGGAGFQRPFELATLRLRNMVEVLTHWTTYVPSSAYLTQRGGTFLFDAQGKLLYEHRDQGILGFAANMSQPLAFLNELVQKSTTLQSPAIAPVTD
jgi:AhpC/TSA antioxidant enzyme